MSLWRYPWAPGKLPPADVSHWNLGSRELEVLQHLAAGRRNRPIAGAVTSENTVIFHVRNIFRKMGVRSRGSHHNYGVR
jgi:DNA-binding NarL/FixJ family response regulator